MTVCLYSARYRSRFCKALLLKSEWRWNLAHRAGRKHEDTHLVLDPMNTVRLHDDVHLAKPALWHEEIVKKDLDVMHAGRERYGMRAPGPALRDAVDDDRRRAHVKKE